MNRTTTAVSIVLLTSLAIPFASALDHEVTTHTAQQSPPGGARKQEGAQAPKPASPQAGPIAIGAELDAALSLVDPDGRTQLLKDLHGKTVVLHFFGTRAGSSAVCISRLKALSEAYAGKGVDVIAVDANADEFDTADGATLKRVQEWAKKNGIQHVMFDKNHVLADRLHASVNGHTFIVDSKGMLRYSGPLDDDPKGEHADRANDHVKAALDAVLAGKSPEHASVTPTGDPLVREAKRATEPAPKNPPAKREEPKHKDGGKPEHRSPHHGS